MINSNLLYDDSNPSSIEEYSKKLIGKTFQNVLEDYFGDNEEALVEKIEYFNNPRGKGSLGNLIEEYFFMYKPNNNPEPDFPKAKVELKVTPYEELKNGKVRAGERLVIKMIPYDKEIEDNLEDSHILDKLNLVLLVLYLRVKGNDRIGFQIDYSKLFSILSTVCKEDFEIIKSDYKKIVKKIKNGLAHELSEGDTLYLGASTKGSTAEKSLQPQFYNTEIKAKRRAFCLKQGYMTQVINKYIMNDIYTYESIIKNPSELETNDFESYIKSKINDYVGKSEIELSKVFKIKKTSKNFYSRITMAILGIKSNKAEEFVKADIEVKSIRIEANGTIKEHMSFPKFRTKEFIEEDWEGSEIYERFSQTKFLFVVFKKNHGEYILKGCQFWNMPILDLEDVGYQEWKKAQNVVKEGIKFNIVPHGKTVRVENNLPKASETDIFHVKCHSNKSFYILGGNKYGTGKLGDSDELPNGDRMTNPCFWLNKTYLINQLDDSLKDNNY